VGAPRIGVLALQGDVREHVRSLESVGVDAFALRAVPQLDDIDGLVIPGGESTTMSILAVKNDLFEPLRTMQRSGLPMYGSCAGLIMLANTVADGRADQQTIGGLDIVAQRNAFGRQVDSFEADLPIQGLGDVPFHAVFIRAPIVTAVAGDVQVLAALEDGRIVAAQSGHLLATAFHPELTADDRMHAYFLNMVTKQE